MLYDSLIAPFADFEFMRRALVGTFALSSPTQWKNTVLPAGDYTLKAWIDSKTTVANGTRDRE